MRRFLWFGALVFILAMGLGCAARKDKVLAVEGDRNIAYDSLGTIQVKARTYKTLRSNPSEHYRNVLKKRLVQKAHKLYGADGVIKVEFWPDLNSGTFPDGYIYARGEMIRYAPFPESATSN